MASLFSYCKQLQRFLRDGKQEFWDFEDLIEYTNQARREVAMRAQCVRILPPISAPIISADILNGGTGYTNPTVQISTPDSPGGKLLNPNGAQAVGTATQAGGVIDNVYITYGGDGYFTPVIQINDPTGSGAVIQPNLGPILQTNEFQEQYEFKDIDLSGFPGVESIYAVLSVSIIYAQSRYRVLIYDFSTYQAKLRNYQPGSYYYIPVMGAQFGRGARGSFFLYPVASQQLQLEMDCLCLPSDLQSDLDFDAVPDPWTDAVPYWGAHLAMLEIGNHNLARSFRDLFDERMKRFGAYALPGTTINPYGRP